MKAIQTQLHIKRVSLKPDDSVSFSAETPKLDDESLLAFRKISKLIVNVLIEPESGSSGVLKIKEKVSDGKTPSQRLRGVLFLRWEQLGKPLDDFDVWYRLKMEKIISKEKELLD